MSPVTKWEVQLIFGRKGGREGLVFIKDLDVLFGEMPVRFLCPFLKSDCFFITELCEFFIYLGH